MGSAVKSCAWTAIVMTTFLSFFFLVASCPARYEDILFQYDCTAQRPFHVWFMYITPFTYTYIRGAAVLASLPISSLGIIRQG
jgi:hypothetical protein